MKAAVRLSRRTAWLLTLTMLIAATLVAALLLRSQQTHQVLVAARDLPSGQILSEADFAPAQVSLGPLANNYLTALPAGQTLSTSLNRGELLSRAQLRSADALGQQRFALEPTEPLASDIKVGTKVSIWFVPKSTSSTSEQTPAGLIASDLQVLAIIKRSDSLGEKPPLIELQVTQEQLPALIVISAAEGYVSVVAHG